MNTAMNGHPRKPSLVGTNHCANHKWAIKLELKVVSNRRYFTKTSWKVVNQL